MFSTAGAFINQTRGIIMKSVMHALLIYVYGMIVCSFTYAEQGTTTGMAAFNPKGDVKSYKPGVAIWSGTFVGVSMTDARKGPLHNSGWDCTGEVVIQDGSVHRAGGYCLVTDQDGDTINLMWERTNIPGSPAEVNTKGTYLSGTGKYTGIKGHYTFACRGPCTITSGEYKIP
jgi:hypothetical protein